MARNLSRRANSNRLFDGERRGYGRTGFNTPMQFYLSNQLDAADSD
jgi:hypothetical protein